MDSITENHLPDEIRNELRSLLFQRCCHQRVGHDRSLFLGFGGLVFVKNPRGVSPHGVYEIGTYRSAWRIIKHQCILCGSIDAFDSVDDLQECLIAIEGAICIRIEMLTAFDVRVEFDNGFCVDFLGTFGDGDEIVHIFLPQNRIVSFSIPGRWSIEIAGIDKSGSD